MKKFDILNSEGPILYCEVKQNDKLTQYHIFDQWKRPVAILVEQGLIDFINGKIDLMDIDNNKYSYLEYSPDMRPKLPINL